MCGIAGFLDSRRSTSEGQLRHLALKMADAVRHRGPDDSGSWVDPEQGLAFGFRRLAIIELSTAGSQPMVSHDGRWVVVFNGEIYNHRELRRNLGSYRKGSSDQNEPHSDKTGGPTQGTISQGASAWHGQSDTETLLEAVSVWGVEVAVKRSNGMFALALWDRHERALYLVRDRIGKKPLYYGWVGQTFLFGSELSALRAHPAFRGEVDRNALAIYLRHSYIACPHSIYRGIFKLSPGTILRLDCSKQERREPVMKCYWSASVAVKAGIYSRVAQPAEEVICSLDVLLRDSVALRMVADVPLGVFLSGGIDSSLVTALMQVQSSRPVKTYTIAFHEFGYNEAQHAGAIATFLGTEHREFHVSQEEVKAIVPRISSLFDEPFGDSSQIPTYLISRLAREDVTVALSGDGGDEGFGGYDRYLRFDRLNRRVASLPRHARMALASILGICTLGRLRKGTARIAKHLFGQRLSRHVESGLAGALSGVLRDYRCEDLYRVMISHWERPSDTVLRAVEPGLAAFETAASLDLCNAVESAMYLDTVTYLPGDILTKVDRASMAVSLEVRCPLLDYRVIEFAWSIPFHLKVRNGLGKRLLRNLLARYLPTSLFERPKKGFAAPIGSWLRGALKDWAEEMLSAHRLRGEGYFDTAMIRKLWQEHLQGTADWSQKLWQILMFECWLDSRRSEAIG